MTDREALDAIWDLVKPQYRSIFYGRNELIDDIRDVYLLKMSGAPDTMNTQREGENN